MAAHVRSRADRFEREAFRGRACIMGMVPEQVIHDTERMPGEHAAAPDEVGFEDTADLTEAAAVIRQEPPRADTQPGWSAPHRELARRPARIFTAEEPQTFDVRIKR